MTDVFNTKLSTCTVVCFSCDHEIKCVVIHSYIVASTAVGCKCPMYVSLFRCSLSGRIVLSQSSLLQL